MINELEQIESALQANASEREKLNKRRIEILRAQEDAIANGAAQKQNIEITQNHSAKLENRFAELEAHLAASREETRAAMKEVKKWAAAAAALEAQSLIIASIINSRSGLL